VDTAQQTVAIHPQPLAGVNMNQQSTVQTGQLCVHIIVHKYCTYSTAKF